MSFQLLKRDGSTKSLDEIPENFIITLSKRDFFIEVNDYKFYLDAFFITLSKNMTFKPNGRFY